VIILRLQRQIKVWLVQNALSFENEKIGTRLSLFSIEIFLLTDLIFPCVIRCVSVT